VLLRDALKIARILHRRAQGRRVRASFETGDSRSASGVWHHPADWRLPTSTHQKAYARLAKPFRAT